MIRHVVRGRRVGDVLGCLRGHTFLVDELAFCYLRVISSQLGSLPGRLSSSMLDLLHLASPPSHDGSRRRPRHRDDEVLS